MAQEHLTYEDKVSPSTGHKSTALKLSRGSEKTTYSDAVRTSPQVVEVTDQHNSTLPVSNEYMVESPETAVDVEVIPTPPLVTEENLRFSLRNVQSKLERVDDKAVSVAKKRDIEGISKSPNSFDALTYPVFILKAVKMGVNIPDADFTSIDILRELEKTRNIESLDGKNDQAVQMDKTMLLTNAKGDQTPLNMCWGDEKDLNEENFTVVRSRKKRERKINVVISRPVTRSQKGGASSRDDKGNSTLHPSRGTTRRKK